MTSRQMLFPLKIYSRGISPGCPIKNDNYLVNCVYASNEDIHHAQSRQLFEDMFDDAKYHEYNHVIYADDYNIAHNPKDDTCRYLLINNPNLNVGLQQMSSLTYGGKGTLAQELSLLTKGKQQKGQKHA